MFPFLLQPTSTPHRWYSQRKTAQEEFRELAYLEAKRQHEHNQAMRVNCLSGTSNHQSLNGLEDHDMEEVLTQDDSHTNLNNSSSILPSTNFHMTDDEDNDYDQTHHDDTLPLSVGSLSYLVSERHPMDSNIGTSTTPSYDAIMSRRITMFNTPPTQFYLSPSLTTTGTTTADLTEQRSTSPDLADFLSPGSQLPGSSSSIRRNFFD